MPYTVCILTFTLSVGCHFSIGIKRVLIRLLIEQSKFERLFFGWPFLAVRIVDNKFRKMRKVKMLDKDVG